MQKRRMRYSKSIEKTFLGLLILGTLSSTAAVGAVLRDVTIKEIDSKKLCLFADCKIEDINIRQPAPDIIEMDIPDFAIMGGPRIVVSPHPKIKFLRISQIGRQPPVMHAVVVLEENCKFEPKIENGKLILTQISERKLKEPTSVESVKTSETRKVENAKVTPKTSRVESKVEKTESVSALPLESRPKTPTPVKPPKVPVAPKVTNVTFAPETSSLESRVEKDDFVPPLSCEPITPISKSAKTSDILDQRVNLHFEQQEITTILEALARKFGLRIFADAGVKGKFTVHAVDMPLREVLKSLLLQKNFQYTLRGKDLTVISLGEHADRVARELLFKDLSLKDALQTLSRMMNINIIVHESVEDKKVNFYVDNLSLDELLELLTTTNDLVKKPYNENTYIVMTQEEAKRYGKKQYRTFKLVNAKPSEVIATINDSKAMSEKIDTANMSVNERINALSVYDTPENLDLIAHVIENIDEKLKQAVIEVKLLEVSRSVTRDLGIEQIHNDKDINDGKGIRVKVPDITRIPSSYAIEAQLIMFEKQGKAKLLASPKIRAVHGKAATINIGKKMPVPYYRYEVASTTYLGYIPQTYKEYRDLDTGIELNVTPEISHDNEISLDIDLRVDEIDKINDDGQPTRNSRSSHSYIRMKDGETVVLGGLISSKHSTDENSPALINKVPLLKRLTSRSQNAINDVEMIMLVTPRLVNLDEPEEERPNPGELIIQTR